MASDVSQIVQDELANTLEQLLAKSSSVESVAPYDSEGVDSEQAIKVGVKYEFADFSSTWTFYIPTVSAAKFEFFMLSGMGELKEHIDDEIADAVNEIVSNICGSISTSINAQGFEDVAKAKFEATGSEIVQIDELSNASNIYTFMLKMGDEDTLPVFIAFDDEMLPYISGITGEESSQSAPDAGAGAQGASAAPSGQSNNSLGSFLGDDSAQNLKLLFDIKLKLSVRLGTKTFLLKDILRWDVGEIIELNQMVNEPLDILVNGIKIGEGEAVIVENKFGLKVRSIGDANGKLSGLGL